MTFHGKIMNLQCDTSALDEAFHQQVKYGHKAARHQAAEFGAEADAVISEAAEIIKTLLALHLAHHNLTEHAAAREFLRRVEAAQ